MKTKINISKWAFLALGILFLSSCSEDVMDKVNENKDNAKDVTSKFIITDIETSTAFNIVGSDLSFYASVYMEHEVGTYNQMWDAETRNTQPTSASTYDNSWKAIYQNLKNAKTVIAKCSTGGVEVGNQITKGVAEVLAAYNLAVLTDLFGDVPWSQACDLAILQPTVDKQKDVYTAVFAYLNAAITDLAGKDAAFSGSLGGQDLIFGGSAKAWTKFAYGLKARYTMHLLYRSTDKTTDLNNIITWADKSFTSADEDAKYAVYQGQGTAAASPFAQFYYDRDYFSVSQSFLDKLTARNDPRANVLFMDASWNLRTNPAKIYAAPNGTADEAMDSYDLSVYSVAFKMPTNLLSYHELQFLKAEAYARLNDNTNAWAALQEAISSCISTKITTLVDDVNTEQDLGATAISDTQIQTYLTSKVKPLFDANPLQEIMVQKYLGFYGGEGEALECYNDYRRLQAFGQQSFIPLSNPKNSSKFPLRYGYGTSDVTANPNVETLYGNGQYVYSEKVWWAGGSR
ncbi:SusD/RagB family nutrient-binding outer membrane lipoprotein [Paludibacter sp.]|uniref:SusD/RagB family nutrient-binding outer membrane lipoprotein n=1 Tax=Paludibacter sp. TaxID=1898105 RepID=UPI0013540FB1|nr:SusD/RagB family nutrient-binding outer membrane lipoprotein [Paludibacter sp.]MTK51981.1 SusD/RagB family nutrient-binding outer membrane lipoprotein [Paludibacter sp.]